MGCERLKAEKFADCMGAGAAAGLGGGAGAGAETGELMSKRPPILLVAGGGAFAEAGGGEAAADEKSPQSPPKLSFRGAGAGFAAGCMGGDMTFEGGAGFASKKDPPLSAGLAVEDGCRVWPVGDVRPEKGDGLTCCCGGDWPNESEPNASFIPPNELAFEGCWVGDVSGGDCMPPKAPMFDCGCCCC